MSRKARNSDPTTSHEAAAHMKKAASYHRSLILEDLKKHGSGTFEEIAIRASMRFAQVWRRLSELEEAGTARPTGEVRKGSTGYMQRVWMAIR